MEKHSLTEGRLEMCQHGENTAKHGDIVNDSSIFHRPRIFFRIESRHSN